MKSELLLMLLGAVLVLEGLAYFLAPERLKRFFRLVQSLDDRTLRIAGFCAAAIGLLIIYLMRDRICP
jgi:uncharacterized protein YjeT (DUF2065 family)